MDNYGSFLNKAEVSKMGKSLNRVLVKLKSTESPFIYYTKKNKMNTENRLELKKYDPVVKKHVLFKETK